MYNDLAMTDKDIEDFSNLQMKPFQLGLAKLKPTYGLNTYIEG
jgi:hypothetical protein